MHEPRTVHGQGTLRVLAYVKRVLGKGLVYRKMSHLQVEAYLESGYARDKGDRKSTFGFCTYVGGNLVTWQSKKQGIVSRSSAEVEYRSMARTVSKMMWMRSFLIELGFSVDTPIAMYCDN